MFHPLGCLFRSGRNLSRRAGAGPWRMDNEPCKIPMAEYQAFAKDYNPVKYDPDQWARMGTS